MLLNEKYKPTSQKSLFHKDIISHIRKWLKSCNANARQMLFVYGPIGCAKSVTIEVLLKGFNIHNVDPLELRSNDKALEIASTIPAFHDFTLSSIETWNKSGTNDKNNILLVDNIELCDKTISYFIECVKKVNIPIILICNTPKLKDVFDTHENCTFIEFKKPSLLELKKLVTDINSDEKLNLTKENIKALVEKSKYDIRQLFFILQQWSLSHTLSNFNDFINDIQEKHTDIDLVNKLLYFCDKKHTFHFNNSCNIALSEPLVISCGLYQNYLNVLPDAPIENIANISQNISESNMIHNKIFDEQYWELYDFFACASCVFPSYHIKNLNISIDPNFYMSPYKDFSYNYINSYKEIRNHITTKSCQHHIAFSDHTTCFFTAQMLTTQIETLNSHFESQKKGKNTSKQEKLDMCQNITDPNIQTTLSNLVGTTYFYSLFDFDNDDIVLNKRLYLSDEQLHTRLTKIDIRMLKRFINIFTFKDTSKLVKSHLELIIKYNLLLKLRETITPNSQTTNVEELTQDLADIWNF
jgi:hypothetical protein